MNIVIPDKLYTLSVSKMQISSGNTNMYSVGFRNLIENHLNIIKFLPNTKSISVDAKKEQIFTGDFYSLIYEEFNVPQDLWWIVLRLNDLISPLDYDGQIGSILLPARHDIENLLNRFLNSSTM